MKEKRIQGNSRRSWSQKLKPEPPATYPITSSRKYIPALIPAVAKLIPLTEINIVRADTIMQPLQCCNPFPVLAIVWDLLENALLNEIVGLVDKKAVNISMQFLAKRLAAVQLLSLGKE